MKKIKEENWYSNQPNIIEIKDNIEIIQKTLNNYYSSIIEPLKEELDLCSGEELNDIKIDYDNLYDEYKNNLNIVNNLNIELDKLLKKYDDLYLEYKNKIDKKENEHTSSTIFDGKNKKKTYSYNKIQDVYINSEDGEIYKTISKYSVLIENEIESIPTKLSEKDEKIS